jgi:hypothetical protein
MDMRTDAQEVSTQALNQASAILTDNKTIHDNHDQSDDNVDTSSKKSDSGIYMEAKAEGQIAPVSPIRTEGRDVQSVTKEHPPGGDYHDEATSYTEDSASIMSNTTTISSLIDEEDESKQVYNIETTNPSRLFW